MRRISMVAVLLITISGTAQAQARPELQALRTADAPRIDGDLEDEVWAGRPLQTSNWTSYSPLHGTRLPQTTEVRIAYDDRYLYFAFRCIDGEPDKIRATITKRDDAFNDDWIGLSLDSNGNGQSAYHLFVNPSGVQMDALNTSSSGERFEADLVWDSAGKRTDEGYDVEIRLPLQSIRFHGGENVRMGILFWRKVSRTGISGSWPDIPPGQGVFNRHAQLIFPELKQPKLIEFLPSVTQSINQLRSTTNGWNKATGTSNVGLSVKYGITSSVTLDATVNPDFSQVESDAFQIQVNQRYPTFFSEKRPFFMEGMGLFNLADSDGDGNMIAALHTRNISNPNWGAKLTGSAGKVTFGVLNAADAAVEGKSKIFNVGRVTYGLGQSNYVGGMVVDTEHAGRSNRVAAGDLSIRFRKKQQLTASFLQTRTGIAGQGATRGSAAQVTYSFSDRSYSASTQVEHYAKDFQMDTAFYNRTGFTSGWAFAQRDFYPKDTGQSVLKRFTVFTWNRYGRDQTQNGNEWYSLTGVRMNFTRQGFFRIDQDWGREPWKGRRFDTGKLRILGNVLLFPWLNLSGSLLNQRAIFYDPVDPFQGGSRNTNLGFTLQPSSHFSQTVNYSRSRFDRASDGQRIYAVHIVNTRTTYQFNRRFLVRVLEQFDSSRKRLLTDILASYEFAPGTVLQAGYGSLYEKDSPEGYRTTSRSLFFKASYLHRF